MHTPRICLVMMVKDEAQTIERAIASALPLISSWCIVDTGSSDDTRERVCDALRDVPGRPYDRPWVSFCHNRTEALQLAALQSEHGIGLRSDYLLTLDADDLLPTVGGSNGEATGRALAAIARADADVYELTVRMGAFDHSQPHIFRTSLKHRYTGSTHEVYEVPDGARVAHLDEIQYACINDGFCRRAPVARKYERDAALLRTELETEPANTRAAFYLAQTLKDLGRDAEAIEAYERRAFMAGGWEEETWWSLYQVARLRARKDPSAAMVDYLRAYRFRPTRAETLVDMAADARRAGEYALAWVFANAAINTPRPNDRLFLDASVYMWRALDEYALACLFTGRYGVARASLRQLLSVAPADEQGRIRTNLAVLDERCPVRSADPGSP